MERRSSQNRRRIKRPLVWPGSKNLIRVDLAAACFSSLGSSMGSVSQTLAKRQ